MQSTTLKFAEETGVSVSGLKVYIHLLAISFFLHFKLSQSTVMIHMFKLELRKHITLGELFYQIFLAFFKP